MSTLLATFLLLAAIVQSSPITPVAAPPMKNITATSAPPQSYSDGTANNNALITALLTAPTALERVKLLSNDQDFVFDFNSPPTGATTHGKAGSIVRSSQMTFPALVGQDAAFTMGFLGPCGFNTPHTHPRSAELNLVIEGTLYTQMETENSARTVTNKLEKYQMTVFPQGAMHTEFNPTCSNATFVASFGSSDPGTQQVAQTLLGLSGDLVSAAFDNAVSGADIAYFYSVLPSPVAMGVTECLARCGIAKN